MVNGSGLQGSGFASLIGWSQMVERGHHPPGPVGHASQSQPHLDAAQRSSKHEVVERPKMSDAKDLARKSPEAGSERHVEALENELAEAIGVVAGGHGHGGQGVRVLERLLAEQFESPCPHGGASRFPVTLMTAKDVRK